jgi:hypothetical protein
MDLPYSKLKLIIFSENNTNIGNLKVDSNINREKRVEEEPLKKRLLR